MNAKEAWDRSVSAYISSEDIYNEEINHAAITRYLGDIQGKTILDYGCGYGIFARNLKKKGAGQVIATDTSSSMIQLAKAADVSVPVQYYYMPENNLSFLGNATVDKVTANLVFMMIPTAQEIAASMQEIHRVLRPGGIFVYLITHPCFIQRGGYNYYNVFKQDFHYMQEGASYRFILRDVDGQDVDGEFFDYHHTLTTYLNVTLQVGFQLTAFEELAYPDKVIKKYGVSKAFQTFPQALVVQWVKPW